MILRCCQWNRTPPHRRHWWAAWGDTWLSRHWKTFLPPSCPAQLFSGYSTTFSTCNACGLSPRIVSSRQASSDKRTGNVQKRPTKKPDIDPPRQDLEKHKRWADVKRGIGPLTRDLPQRNGAGRLRRVPHQAIPKAWRRRLWTISKIWYCSPSRTIWLRSVAQRWRNAKRWRGKDGFFCGVLLLAVFSQVLPTVTLQRENLFVMLHFSVGKKQILFLEN